MSLESITIDHKIRSPLKEIKLPELNKSPTTKHRKGYSIFKESIIQLLKQKPIPPWSQLEGIKPNGYEGNGPNFTDLWSVKEKIKAMKLLNPSSIKSKVAKVFYSSECLRRKKSFDQKFLKRLPLLNEENLNQERHTHSPIKYQTTRSLIKVSSGLI